jgi:hypothetical protein
VDANDVDDNALGGVDSVTVNDLTGTDVVQTNLDLAAALGGNVPDGLVDSVVVNATNGDDKHRRHRRRLRCGCDHIERCIRYQSGTARIAGKAGARFVFRYDRPRIREIGEHPS